MHNWPPCLVHKKPKQMHVCMTDQNIRTIVQISIDPRFEIRDFLNELQNEWMILGKHECFHQICHDIIILFFQLLQQISRTFVNIFMCVPNYKKPQLIFLKTSWVISKERNTNSWQFLLSFTQLSIWRSNFFGDGFTPTILSIASMHSNNRNFLARFVGRMHFGVQIQIKPMIP